MFDGSTVTFKYVARLPGLFVFDRSRDEKRVGEFGRHSLWTGQHVTWTPETLLGMARNAVLARLEQNLHLRQPLRPKVLGLAWLSSPQTYQQGDVDGSRLAQHAGLFFTVPIRDAFVAESLEEKEFKVRGRGHPLTSRFSRIEDLEEMTLDFEPWSRTIVEKRWLS